MPAGFVGSGAASHAPPATADQAAFSQPYSCQPSRSPPPATPLPVNELSKAVPDVPMPVLANLLGSLSQADLKRVIDDPSVLPSLVANANASCWMTPRQQAGSANPPTMAYSGPLNCPSPHQSPGCPPPGGPFGPWPMGGPLAPGPGMLDMSVGVPGFACLAATNPEMPNPGPCPKCGDQWIPFKNDSGVLYLCRSGDRTHHYQFPCCVRCGGDWALSYKDENSYELVCLGHEPSGIPPSPDHNLPLPSLFCQKCGGKYKAEFKDDTYVLRCLDDKWREHDWWRENDRWCRRRTHQRHRKLAGARKSNRSMTEPHSKSLDQMLGRSKHRGSQHHHQHQHKNGEPQPQQLPGGPLAVEHPPPVPLSFGFSALGNPGAPPVQMPPPGPGPGPGFVLPPSFGGGARPFETPPSFSYGAPVVEPLFSAPYTQPFPQRPYASGPLASFDASRSAFADTTNAPPPSNAFGRRATLPDVPRLPHTSAPRLIREEGDGREGQRDPSASQQREGTDMGPPSLADTPQLGMLGMGEGDVDSFPPPPASDMGDGNPLGGLPAPAIDVDSGFDLSSARIAIEHTPSNLSELDLSMAMSPEQVASFFDPSRGQSCDPPRQTTDQLSMDTDQPVDASTAPNLPVPVNVVKKELKGDEMAAAAAAAASGAGAAGGRPRDSVYNQPKQLRVVMDLTAYKWNIQRIGSLLGPQQQLGTIIKAPSGDNMRVMANTAIQAGAGAICVSSNADAVVVRSLSDTTRIIRVRPAFADEVACALPYRVEELVGDLENARELSLIAQRHRAQIPVHIEIDSGIGRAGFFLHQMADLKQVANMAGLRVVGLVTTFLDSGGPSSNMGDLERLLQAFHRYADHLEKEGVIPPNTPRSCGSVATDAALIRLFVKMKMSIIRIGRIAYGLKEAAALERVRADPSLSWAAELRPVMSALTWIVSIRKSPAAATASQATGAKEDTILATVPVGFGQGYPRSLSHRGVVLVKGHRCRLAGAVSMDMTTIDVTPIASQTNVQVGDEVVLFGENLALDEMASGGGAVSAEVLMSLAWLNPVEYIGQGDQEEEDGPQPTVVKVERDSPRGWENSGGEAAASFPAANQGDRSPLVAIGQPVDGDTRGAGQT
ncbi:unnamed protein product [Vitrella brassicaformis CCMP3155]|uniref:Alanine racemase C-terminal domain-containing protein n=2 Tax=Vitrella brassicaformis TaxID=1169539 RepID=A0A0G4FV35_VITBC|nr:unnamed protein product [Vitrella brassicaformis CCMP3155]|eukprot:CEM18466.1 unnamed protein product [Vitrella brassicaformis CCMP3155]